MKIQPRQDMLEILHAAARASMVAEVGGARRWEWSEGSNSVSDAEQLLCFLLPAEVDGFELHNPDDIGAEVRRALAPLGDASAIPRILIDQLTEYMRRYTNSDGTPFFAGGDYIGSVEPDRPASDQQRSFDVVESFAVSITLSLATLRLVQRNRLREPRRDRQYQLDELAHMASRRLTAAMVGLLRSFTVAVFKTHSPEGREMLRGLNQDRIPESMLVPKLRTELNDISTELRRITTGSGQLPAEASELEESDSLMELGWTWGIVRQAPLIDLAEIRSETGRQSEGYSIEAPYLYFTMVALDAIAVLSSERTRREGLLDELQQQLAHFLRIRWDLTQRYWATVAGFGDGRWPLEDLPWRTSDGEESDYFTLSVMSIAARRIAEISDNLPVDLGRLAGVLTELAHRSRINRRPAQNDPALSIHSPGLTILLETGDFGTTQTWTASDFAPQLLKRTLSVAQLSADIAIRDRIVEIADDIWAHLRLRRLREGRGRGLWDQPSGAFPGIARDGHYISWRQTLRIMESLVIAADFVASPPPRSSLLVQIATGLFSEASHLFDRELMAVDSPIAGEEDARSRRGSVTTIRDKLDRAREILDDRPGTAISLLQEVLSELDRLANIRRRVWES